MDVHVRALCAAALLLALTAALAGRADADVTVRRDYRGPAAAPSTVVGAPTADSGQSKLWWHDQSWWSVMVHRPSGEARVFRLERDHAWVATQAVVARRPVSLGDTVHDGSTTYVLLRANDRLLQLSALRYDSEAREYTSRRRSRLPVPDRGAGRAALAQDSTGRLWASFVVKDRLLVAHTDETGRGMTEPFSPSVAGVRLTGRTVEVSDLVSFDGRIGVIWSDQSSGRFRFAVHDDGDADFTWSSERTPMSGRGRADNHISTFVVRDPAGDTVVAAVKTSLNDRIGTKDSPLIVLMVRRPDGRWEKATVSRVSDAATRPAVVVDSAGSVYVVMRQGGDIVEKNAPLDSLAFTEGPGAPVITRAAADVTDPSVASEVVDATTGLVVLASESASKRYWHGELAMDAPTDEARHGRFDESPPSPPRDLQASSDIDAVSLRWQAANDGARWAPAADAARVRRYVVLRDGAEIGESDTTGYVDRSLPDRAATATYAVRAVDGAGNPSEPSPPLDVSLQGSADTEASTWVLPGLVIGGVTVGALLLVAMRPRSTRVTAGYHPPARHRRNGRATRR